tara:strand:- start:3818 stop:4816 length:999 start_codon:yes stop_codon:yes gene_type:complete
MGGKEIMSNNNNNNDSLPPVGTLTGDSIRWFHELERNLTVPLPQGTYTNLPFQLRGRSNQTYGPGDTVASPYPLQKKIQKSLTLRINVAVKATILHSFDTLLEAEVYTHILKYDLLSGSNLTGYYPYTDDDLAGLLLPGYLPSYDREGNTRDPGYSIVKMAFRVESQGSAYSVCLCEKGCKEVDGDMDTMFAGLVKGAIIEATPKGDGSIFGTGIMTSEIKVEKTTIRCDGFCGENPGPGQLSRKNHPKTATNGEMMVIIPGKIVPVDTGVYSTNMAFGGTGMGITRERELADAFTEQLFIGPPGKPTPPEVSDGGMGDWLDGIGVGAPGCC